MSDKRGVEKKKQKKDQEQTGGQSLQGGNECGHQGD